MKLSVVLIPFLGLVLISCDTTRTIAQWERQGLTPKSYAKLVVYVSASTLATRTTIERTVAKGFTKKKLEAVAASDWRPGLDIDTIARMQSEFKEGNADLFLFIKLGGISLTKVMESDKPGSVGGSYMKTMTRIESRLYDVLKDELLMSIDTESDAGPNDDIEDVAEDLASELIGKFKKRAIAFGR